MDDPTIHEAGPQDSLTAATLNGGTLTGDDASGGDDVSGGDDASGGDDGSDLGGRPAAVSPAPVTPVRRKSFLRNVGEYAFLAVLAIVLASFIRSFLGLAFYIPSESMVPTLKVHDRVVVSRLSYRLHAPRRGDIVVFQNPDYPATDSPNAIEKVFRNVFEVFGMRQPEDKNLIKRVVGLPGEKIEIKDNAVWIDGKRLNEPYLKTFYANGGQLDWEGQPPYTEKIPSNEYWMMGDNRSNSKDSRYFHTIKRSAMVGSAFVRVWPPSRLGTL